MFIPVTQVKAMLDAVINLIRTDYNAAVAAGVETESWLYRVLNGNALGSFDFFDQAKSIFIRTDGSARKLQTRLGFDLSITQLPAVYVHQPSETLKGVNGIGWGLDTNEYYENADGRQIDKVMRGFGSVFEWVVTSPNALETRLVYEVLHAALIGTSDTFNEYYDKFSFTGKELVAKHESMPDPLFIMSIMIDVEYIKQVPQLGTPQQLINLVEFYRATIYDEDAIGNDLI